MLNILMSPDTFVPCPPFPKAFFNIYPKRSSQINPGAMSNWFTLQINDVNLDYSATLSFFYPNTQTSSPGFF